MCHSSILDVRVLEVWKWGGSNGILFIPNFTNIRRYLYHKLKHNEEAHVGLHLGSKVGTRLLKMTVMLEMVIPQTTIQIKVSLCLTNYDDMMTYRSLEVWLQAFLTSALDGGESSASRPSRSSPGDRTPGKLYAICTRFEFRSSLCYHEVFHGFL